MPSFMHEDEPLPGRTTPQGRQVENVEYGYEVRDVDFRALAKWFGGLVLLMVIVLPLVWGGWRFLAAWVARGSELPSPIFADRAQAPTPRVLPNPIDAPPSPRTPLPQPLMGPGDYLIEFRRQENEQLDRLGLRDPETGLARLPAEAVRQLLTKTDRVTPVDSGIDGTRHLAPSGASGGTRMENRLR